MPDFGLVVIYSKKFLLIAMSRIPSFVIQTVPQYAKSLVKWLVDIYDDTEETVDVATILTMVKKIGV